MLKHGQTYIYCNSFIQKGFVSERDVAQAIKSTLLALKVTKIFDLDYC